MTTLRQFPRAYARIVLAAVIVGELGCGVLAGLGDAPVVPPDDPSGLDASPDATLGAGDSPTGVTRGDEETTQPVTTGSDGAPPAESPAPVSHLAVIQPAVYVVRNGIAYSWGNADSFGDQDVLHRRYADASTRTPGEVLGVDGGAFHADSVHGKTHHVCARAGDRAYCWGWPANGRLSGSTPAPQTGPVRTENNIDLVSVTEVAAGNSVSCARLTSGDFSCWGGGGDVATDGDYGQVGVDVDGGGIVAYLAKPLKLGTFVHVEPGYDHACAIETGGTVVCWGRNDFRQAGSHASRACISGPCVAPPTRVGGLSKVRQLSLGARHSCALTEAGEVFCWGGSNNGALGEAALSDTCSEVHHGQESVVRAPCTEKPVRIFDGGVDWITAGDDLTCVVKAGNVYCWGRNDFSSLGRGAPWAPSSPTPGLVYTATGALTGMSEVSAQQGVVCAMSKDGVVYCWGDQGALGSKSLDAGASGHAVQVSF